MAIVQTRPYPASRRGISVRALRIRRGGITVLSAFMMILLLTMAALAVDVGMIYVAKAELQRSADAAALAAADALLQQAMRQGTHAGSMTGGVSDEVQEAAMTMASLNQVAGSAPHLAQNPGNLENGEIVVGELVRTADGKPSLAFNDPSRYNSVLVRVKRTADRNGQLTSFFGKILGQQGVSEEAHAQAAFVQDFQGFRTPAEYVDCHCQEANLKILPFALLHSSWPPKSSDSDEYSWDESSKMVIANRPDGCREVNLYPIESGAGGNWGTVDVGGVNSTTPTLRRQIVEGLSPEDLEPYGGSLRLDPTTGKLILSGDPGLKLGALEPELKKIVGQCRIIPLYSSVTRAGNQAEFTIDGFAAVRVIDVRLRGNVRYLTIQACSMIVPGGIPGPPSTSSQIYSTVFIAQ